MNSQRVEELLSVWLCAREEGRDPSPAELCQDCPELAEVVAAKIAMLRRIEGLAASSVSPLETGCGGGPMATHTWAPVETEADAPAIADRYSIVKLIANGGMGAVYRAWDPGLGRDLAVKVMHPSLRKNAQALRRFAAEARVAAQLQHPGIPPVFNVGKLEDGSPYLAMKVVEGQTLSELLSEYEPGAESALRWLPAFEQVCQSMGYAHSQGFVHRDLKPANVMVGAFGEVQVMDWGLAKRLDGKTETLASESELVPDRPEATAAGSILGTPAYMAPEQARGDVIDARADVFSLGGILCSILTGTPPFLRKDTLETVSLAAAGNLSDAYARLEESDADPELVALAKACLSPNAADRPTDAGDVAYRVAAYRAGIESRLRAAETERAAAEVKAAEQRKRRRVQMGLAASIGLLLLGGLAFAWWEDRQAERWRMRQIEFAAKEAQTQSERQAEATRVEAERQSEAARVERERQAEATRVEAERKVVAERSRTGVKDLLQLTASLRKQYMYHDATEALCQTNNKILNTADPNLAAEIEAARQDLVLVRALDDIRMQRRVWVVSEKRFNTATTAAHYREAMRKRGLDLVGEPTAVVAGKIAVSPVKSEILMALDDWAIYEPDERLRNQVLTVARAADPDSWTDRLRDPTVRQNREAIRQLAEESSNAPPSAIVVLSTLMQTHGLDPSRALALAQIRVPNDFNLILAQACWYHDRDYREALGHYRAAHALRPDCGIVLNNLATTLLQLGDVETAVATFRVAVRDDPSMALAWYNLGVAERSRGQWAAAMEAFRTTLRLDPRCALAYYNLGLLLRDSGELFESSLAISTAMRLDPTLDPERAPRPRPIDSEPPMPTSSASTGSEALRLVPARDPTPGSAGMVRPPTYGKPSDLIRPIVPPGGKRSS